MNRDEAIALAHRTCTTYAHLERVRYGFTEAEMMRFAEAVSAHEREALLTEILRGLQSENDSAQLRAIIASVEEIRARATTPKD